MTEAQELKAQLVALLVMSNEAEDEDDSFRRRAALNEMQRAIQIARPVLETYAADLMVELEDE